MIRLTLSSPNVCAVPSHRRPFWENAGGIVQRAVVCVMLFYVLIALNVHALWSVAVLGSGGGGNGGSGSQQRRSTRAPSARGARSATAFSTRECRAIDDSFTYVWNYVKFGFSELTPDAVAALLLLWIAALRLQALFYQRTSNKSPFEAAFELSSTHIHSKLNKNTASNNRSSVVGGPVCKQSWCHQGSNSRETESFKRRTRCSKRLVEPFSTEQRTLVFVTALTVGARLAWAVSLLSGQLLIASETRSTRVEAQPNQFITQSFELRASLSFTLLVLKTLVFSAHAATLPLYLLVGPIPRALRRLCTHKQTVLQQSSIPTVELDRHSVASSRALERTDSQQPPPPPSAAESTPQLERRRSSRVSGPHTYLCRHNSSFSRTRTGSTMGSSSCPPEPDSEAAGPGQSRETTPSPPQQFSLTCSPEPLRPYIEFNIPGHFFRMTAPEAQSEQTLSLNSNS